MVILDFGLPVNQSLGVIVNLFNWKTDLMMKLNVTVIENGVVVENSGRFSDIF